jgi:hypothetical protein
MPDDAKKREQKDRREKRLKIEGDPLEAMKHFLSKKPRAKDDKKAGGDGRKPGRK